MEVDLFFAAGSIRNITLVEGRADSRRYLHVLEGVVKESVKKLNPRRRNSTMTQNTPQIPA